ncbi:hypothetical protein, partial [Pseudomonas karstica]|uniref:hypothetical protein n=1 Tax=Pseudomonas karstica TaxID=1055468 RepID=UPI001C49917C
DCCAADRRLRQRLQEIGSVFVAAVEARGCDKGRRTFNNFKAQTTVAQPIAGCASGYRRSAAATPPS